MDFYKNGRYYFLTAQSKKLLLTNISVGVEQKDAKCFVPFIRGKNITPLSDVLELNSRKTFRGAGNFLSRYLLQAGLILPSLDKWFRQGVHSSHLTVLSIEVSGLLKHQYGVTISKSNDGYSCLIEYPSRRSPDIKQLPTVTTLIEAKFKAYEAIVEHHAENLVKEVLL